jgi:L-ascorbate metabolism protein UlaG (beta-lactamase superfamily)
MRSSRRGTGRGSVLFVGTATTVIRLGPFTLLTDPNFLHRGQRAYLGYGLSSRRRTEPAIGVHELPRLDAVVLSHLHGDHFDRVARRSLDHHLPVLTTPQAARRLRRYRFTNSLGLSTWASHTLTKEAGSLTVTALPGRHGPGPVNALLPDVMGSLLEYDDGNDEPFRLYLTGDTLAYDGLRAISRRYPRIDLAVLHLGGTKILGVTVTMDARQGVDLLEMVPVAQALPVHYDDYPVFRSPLSDFRTELDRRLPPTPVHFVGRGASLDLPPE